MSTEVKAAHAGKARQKAWKPKVKTGCVTCRNRRVKCDEAKPDCRRCVAAGRKCAGYRTDPKAAIGLSWENHSWNHSWTPLIVAAHGNFYPLPMPNVPSPAFCSPGLLVFDSVDEQASFDFFRSCTVPELTDLFRADQGFWNVSVLQAAMTQPAIRHAITGLGALHRIFTEGCDTVIPGDQVDDRLHFALRQFNGAVKSLSQPVASHSRIDKVFTLMACILFTCFASLQGHQAQTIMHLRNGRNLFDSLQPADRVGAGADTEYDNQFKDFLSMLTSLDTQARSMSCEETLPTWDTRPKEMYTSCLDDHVVFKSVAHARDYFEHLKNSIQCLFEAQAGFLDSPRPSPALTHRQLVQSKERGQSAFAKWLDQQPSLNREDRRAVYVLQIDICIIDVYLALYPLMPAQGEMSWDHVEPQFEKIVRLSCDLLDCHADQLHEYLSQSSAPSSASEHGPSAFIPDIKSILSHRPPPAKPVFNFSQGVIGPLYTVATHCRSPTLRREAIALLLSFPRREGLWDSFSTGRVAWELMRAEEEMARLRLIENRAPRDIRSAADIPADCRVQYAEVVYVGLRTARVHLRMAASPSATEDRKPKLLVW